MKKRVYCLILLAVLMLLCSCSQSGGDAAVQKGSEAGVSFEETTVMPESSKQTVLMVYMVGSDLETRAGAGTDDLMEMENSGVDLSNSEIIVYAAGTPYWHNDVADGECNNILRLTKDGFVSVEKFESVSMCESETLAFFLNYVYENYKAEEYSLVLWNHGSGPVMGYGMDIVYEKDALTLSEMISAMQASPFNEDNKLAWVGFDACLMASAELAFVWSDYADYLVSSQEIEPSFGWSYEFLSGLGKTDTPTLLKSIIDSYDVYCRNYYEKKGYENTNATLSCVDLSYADELESAVNGLFSSAAKDMPDMYNRIVQKRVETRTFGKATTGSDYDLVDLGDMSKLLSEFYPEEAAVLDGVIDEMVVYSMAHSENSCGMSIYYPFYNKYYFENGWGEIYSNLGTFGEYNRFLEFYQMKWLEKDKPDFEMFGNMHPTVKTDGEYIFELTPEQSEIFADARYYILKRTREEIYTVVYGSRNVTKDNNTLIANYGGEAIYVENNNGRHRFMPVVVEYETLGDYTYYSVIMQMAKEEADLWYDDENYERPTAFRANLVLDNRTNEFSMSSLVPTYSDVGKNEMTRGKAPEVNLEEWHKYRFPQQQYQYILRYDNGIIRPVSDWIDSGARFYNEVLVEDGFEFVYLPLADEEHYIIFEIEDTYGNAFCSEPILINTSGGDGFMYIPEDETASASESEPEPPLTVFEWTSSIGDQLPLLDENGVKVNLTYGYKLNNHIEYSCRVINENDFDIVVSLENFIYADNVKIDGDYGSSIYVEANSDTLYVLDFQFEKARLLGLFEENGSMGFDVVVSEYDSDGETKIVCEARRYHIDFTEYSLITNGASQNVTYDLIPESTAKEQVLYDCEEFTITLLGLNDDEYDFYDTIICVENHSDKDLELELDYSVTDDVLRDEYMAMDTSAHSKTYFFGSLNCLPKQVEETSPAYDEIVSDDWELSFDSEEWTESFDDIFDDVPEPYAKNPYDIPFDNEVKSISDLEFIFKRTFKSSEWKFDSIRCPVKLETQAEQKAEFTEGENVIYDKNGIRIAVVCHNVDHNTWTITVVNDSNNAIRLNPVNCSVNGVSDEFGFELDNMPFEIYPGTKCMGTIGDSYSEFLLESITFNIAIMDEHMGRVLYYCDEPVTLTIN